MQTIEEFLKKDTSYKCPDKGLEWIGSLKNFMHSQLMKKQKLQREAYEIGVKVGFDLGWRTFRDNLVFPESKNLTEEEYKDAMILITRLGYLFDYIPFKEYYINPNTTGLVIMKNEQAYKKGVVVSQEVRKQIMELVKSNSKK